METFLSKPKTRSDYIPFMFLLLNTELIKDFINILPTFAKWKSKYSLTL